MVSSRRYTGLGWRWVRSLGYGLICTLALLGTVALPSYSQFTPPEDTAATAPVVIDGRTIFELASTKQVSAEERAETISESLEKWAIANEEVDVTTAVRSKANVILVNGRYLMTVTQPDAALGADTNPKAKASQWAELLDTALTKAQRERTQEGLEELSIAAIGALILAILVSYLAGYFWRRSLRPIFNRLTATQEDGQSPPAGLNLLLSLILSLLRLGLWFGVITYITNLFPYTRQLSYVLRRQALAGFINPSLRLGQNNYSLLSISVLLAMVLGVFVLSGIFTNFLRSRVLRLTGMDRGSREAISILVKYSFIFVGVVVLLQIWGLDLSSLAIIASALGVGIGLGLQNIAKDFGSGLILVFERPIQVGEFVEFGSFQGIVERIGARSTEIKTLDQISIIVPNSRFLEQEVINWSHRNPVSRIRLPIGVAYSSDPAVVKQILTDVSYQHSEVLSKPPPQVFFIGFGDSALNFDLLVWIADPAKQLIIKSDLYFDVEAALREHSIEIPFPQQDLHLRSGQLPVELSTEVMRKVRQSQDGGDRLPSQN